MVGPPPAAESYLAIDKLIEVARRTGADCIHPGYGFLSERAPFIRAVEEAGLVFIGPSADAVEAMGDKTQARTRVSAAGVPVVGMESPRGINDPCLGAFPEVLAQAVAVLPERQVQQRTAHLNTLLQVSQELFSARSLDGVLQRALRLHPYYRGKIQMMPKCPVGGLDDFSIWYTPGG